MFLSTLFLNSSFFREAVEIRAKHHQASGTKPFEEYLQEPDRMDKLSAMHPYRKLRGLAFSLSEHRRNACMKVIELCRFRQVSVNGVTQLIADVPQDELSSESFSFTVTSLASLALILIGKILDIPLPFPMVYGTVVSSSCLHTELGGKSSCFPKILHAYKRTLHSAQTCSNLLSENFRQIVSQANQVPLASSVLVQAADESVVQALYAVISAFALGREILSVNKKTSPALSASGSPAVSASYRIIEQSTAEGGEWTLLDQL